MPRIANYMMMTGDELKRHINTLTHLAMRTPKDPENLYRIGAAEADLCEIHGYLLGLKRGLTEKRFPNNRGALVWDAAKLGAALEREAMKLDNGWDADAFTECLCLWDRLGKLQDYHL